MGEDVAKQYGVQLLDLKMNSKPIINVLTMMAEDYIRHAPVVVQTIEKHLNRVQPELKLPVLYLIDSIVKNVKKEYNNLFTQNIVSTFCGVFEKVDDKVKSQMFRLRQTWNEVFPLRKLYAIDVRCHQLDKHWPISPPPNNASIHVNPKFLNTPPRASAGGSSSLSSPDVQAVVQPLAPIDATEAEMREKLLLKQKELLELQQQKIELELMQTKAALEEKRLQETMKTRQETNKAAQEAKRVEELESAIQQEKLLLQRAEMAKNKTDIALRTLSTYPNRPTSSVPVTSQPPQIASHPVVSDPRLVRQMENKARIEANIAKDKSRTNTTSPVKLSKAHEGVKAAGRTAYDCSAFRPKTSLIKPISPIAKITPEPEDSQRKLHHDVVEIDMFGELNRKPKDSKGSTNKDRRSKDTSREKDDNKGSKRSRERSRSSERNRSSKDKKAKDNNYKDVKKENQTDRKSKERDVKKDVVDIKRDSDEDSEDEMKGFSPLVIKPKRLSTTDSDSKDSPSRISPSRLSQEKKEITSSSITKDFNHSKSSPSRRSADLHSVLEKGGRTPTLGASQSTIASSSQSSFGDDISGRSFSVSPNRSPSKRSRTSSERSDKESKHPSSKVADKKDSKGRRSRYSKEKRVQTKGRERDRGHDDEISRSSAHKPDQWKDYHERQKAVLKRNYRKTTGVETEEEENQVPMPQTLHDSSAVSDSGSTSTGDVDLRFQGLKDVDLRKESESQEEPPSKKSRSSGSTIENLFGREDVDLRQPRSGSWSQVKKPSKGDRHARGSSQDDEDIRDILQQQNRNRPPPPISPAHSVSSVQSSCDPLGRPLLYNKLPDDPEERKRSLDSRSLSIDPVEHFRAEFIDRAIGEKGELSQTEVKKIFAKAQEHVDQGIFNTEQYLAVMKQLSQINEASAMREVQQMQLREPTWPASNGANLWTDPAHPQGPWAAPVPEFQPRGPVNMPRFPASGPPVWPPRMNVEPSQWDNNQLPRPIGPNPFEEALMPRQRVDHLIPRVNDMELRIADRDTASSIPIDKIMRQLRFYGDAAVILMGVMADEPKEIAFQRDGRPRTVLINGKPLEIIIGEVKRFELNRKQHTLKIGAPTRELYIDDRHYEVCFGGPIVRIHVDNRMHTFQLTGPPPQVELGKVPRYDLVAGRVNLIIDAVEQITVYLDEKPQKIDLFPEPIILRFCDNFRTVTLNGRPFPTNFGARLPFTVTIPNAGEHYFRFSALTPATEKAIGSFIRARMGLPMEAEELPPAEGFGPFRGRGRGRGGRGRGVGPRARDPMENVMMPHVEDRNPLDMLNNLFPYPRTADSSEERRLRKSGEQFQSSYESEVKGESEKQPTEESSSGFPDIAKLLAMAAELGMLPSNNSSAESETPKEETVAEEPEKVKEKTVETPSIPPLETVDVSLVSDVKDYLKERREKLIDQLWTGVQCASCGLRFPPDQTVRYSQHLDWHFRHNRREKAKAKKAQSRDWYYDLSDWIQFEVEEEIEARAASIFEKQEDAEGDAKSPTVTLNQEEYTIKALGHDGAVCPQCGETFESYYDEELEDWRLRDALLDESEGETKVYHPACHQDYLKSLVEETVIEEEPMECVTDLREQKDSPDENKDAEYGAEQVEDDEVLIIKEGKKEVVVMEIDVDDDEMSVKDTNDLKNDENNEKIANDNQKESENGPSVIEEKITESENSDIISVCNDNSLLIEKSVNVPSYSVLSKTIQSPIVIHDEDSSSNFLPGLSEDSSGGVFGVALGARRERSESPEAVEERKIVYKSMAFDFPKIKIEPVDDVPESDEQEVQDSFLQAEKVPENNPTLVVELDKPDVPVEPENIDLTIDDDSMEDVVDGGSRPLGQITAIDGNLQHEVSAPVPFIPPTKIRINITGVDVSASSRSPKSKRGDSTVPAATTENSASSTLAVSNPIDDKGASSPGENGGSSPVVNDSDSENKKNSEIVFTEEMKRLKPRLVGRKLVNVPPKQLGKEESGLCVIC